MLNPPQSGASLRHGRGKVASSPEAFAATWGAKAPVGARYSARRVKLLLLLASTGVLADAQANSTEGLSAFNRHFPRSPELSKGEHVLLRVMMSARSIGFNPFALSVSKGEPRRTRGVMFQHLLRAKHDLLCFGVDNSARV